MYVAEPSALGAIVPAAPIFPREVLTTGVVACGPMFTHGRVDFVVRDRSTHTDAPGRFPREGATVAIEGGRAVVRPGAAPGDAAVAVQGYPWIVRDGEIHASPTVDAEHVGRVALVVLRDGRVGIAVRTGPMFTFARELDAGGAEHVVYLDGGGSTFVRADGRTRGQEGERRLPSFVILRATGAHTSAPSSTGDLVLLALIAAAASKRRARR